MGGDRVAERVLEIAAAGGHHLLLVGPSGSGMGELARSVAALLPALTPFRSPASTVSAAGLLGGGRWLRPGEASLAHSGVLVLEELVRFGRPVLEALRQPLDEGRVTLIGRGVRHELPGRFTLVATMNPCPCGHRGDPHSECRCSRRSVEGYWRRIPPFLLDRIDLRLEVPARWQLGLGSAARVAAARGVQAERFGPDVDSPFNAAMGPEEVRRFCALDAAGRRLLDAAYERLRLSARAVQRVLQVARTLADLDGGDRLRSDHVGEAVELRSLPAAAIGLEPYKRAAPAAGRRRPISAAPQG